MKTLKHFAMMLVLVTMGFAFSSCSDDDEPTPDNPIVGTWKMQDEKIINGHPGEVVIRFNSNNTGAITANYTDGTDADTYNFEYVLGTDSDGRMTIQFVWTTTHYIIFDPDYSYYVTATNTRLILAGETYIRM